MISETEKYHGIVFSRIVRNSMSTSIQKTIFKSNSSYLVNQKGLFIKYSTKRMSPWLFTFTKDQQDEIESLSGAAGHVVVALVCGEDGVASLDSTELKVVLDDNFKAIERITVSRPPRGKYRISGTDGRLTRTIGDSDFPGKLFLVDPKNISGI